MGGMNVRGPETYLPPGGSVVYPNQRAGIAVPARGEATDPAGRREEDTGVRASFSPESLARAQGALAPDKARKAQTGDEELTKEEQREVQELKQRDTEVRRHEQAHIAAGGRYARGGAHYEYTTGPDGRQYASGGEVSIDVSAARTPEATIAKAQVVRRAALAPAQPSGQDRQVAAAASQMETEARMEIAKERQEEMRAQQEEEQATANPVLAAPADSETGSPKILAPQSESNAAPTALKPPKRPNLDNTPYNIRAQGPSGPRKLDLRV